jgi:hypothetical protein
MNYDFIISYYTNLLHFPQTITIKKQQNKSLNKKDKMSFKRQIYYHKTNETAF